MPGPSDHIDPTKPVLHVARRSDGFDPSKPVPHIQTLEMSWGVVDVVTGEVMLFEATGGQFASAPGHRYLIFIRVNDMHGVQKITLDGSGKFDAETNPDNRGQPRRSPERLPASLPHQEFVRAGAAPTLQSLVAVMKPDIGAFELAELSCGFYDFGLAGNLEYFATSGLMTFSATATNVRGDQSSASLTTSA